MKFKINYLLYLIPLLFFICIISQCKKDKEWIAQGLSFTGSEISLITSGGEDSSMYITNFWIYEDSLILRDNNKDVDIKDSAMLKVLKSRMYATVTDPSHPGVGLAAPQVAINRKACFVQRYDKGGLTSHPFEFYLNAKITAYSDTVKQKPDGCLSIPDPNNEYEYSYRAIWVDVEYDLLDGTHVTERITQEYTAHIFQHEIDHLYGIVYLDRMVEQGKFTVLDFVPPKDYVIPMM